MQKPKKTVVIGFVGSTLDQGKKEERWQRWRPTMSLLMHEDLLVDELVLLHDRRSVSLIEHLKKDATQISPSTQITGQQVNIRDPWDFSDMYGALYDFVKSYPFDTEKNNYYLHITTGTHVAQICWYLLIDAHYLPAKLIQSSPAGKQQPEGEYRIIDLDLSRYAALTQRFENEQSANWQQLKANIATKNKGFNQLIQEYYQLTEEGRGQTFWQAVRFTPYQAGTADFDEWNRDFLEDDIDLKAVIQLTQNPKPDFLQLFYRYSFPDRYYICLSDPDPENPTLFGTDHEVFFTEVTHEGSLEDFLNRCMTPSELMSIIKAKMNL